jgi:multidrug resistance protein, MATE family
MALMVCSVRGARLIGKDERSMQSSNKSTLWFAEFRATLWLAWPMVLTNLAQNAMTATDVLMLGWLSPDALAAGAIGTNIYFIPVILGLGLVLGVAPVLAHEIGSFKFEVRRVRQTVRHGLWIAVLAAIPIWCLLWQGEAILLMTGQQPNIAALSGTYLRTLMWAALPFFGYIVLRSFISALERPMWALVITVGAVGLNALANYALIFGNFGFPALGIRGSGLATTFSSLMMFLGLVLVIALDRQFRRYHLFGRLWRLDAKQFKHLARLGISIGLFLLFEVALFSVSGLVMGTIGRDTVAAYAIALQVASLSFMVPLGISQAATVRVGLAFGAHDIEGVSRAGWTSFGIGVGFMACMSLIMLAIPQHLVGAFLTTGDADTETVRTLAVTFMAYAALFQIVDGAQSVAGGMLRGLQDTKIPVIIGGTGYWLVGMPVGLLLAFTYDFKGEGVWIGLASGLAFVAIALIWRWILVTQRLPQTMAALR